MPQSLAKVYLHIVFSTKNRQPLISPDIENELHKYIGGILTGVNCPPIKIYGTEDHVHILCLLSRTITMSKLLEEIKKASSKWIKSKDEKFKKFYWQNGYGVFSVSQSNVKEVESYIERQKEHHKRYSFQEEFIKLLKKYRIEYDERYIWD